ncbi:MAG: prephenate dehydrogenase [Clostridia bacterium]|nr:prephenate dehydrogenase [Clostridia bacterium]
MKICVAGLGIIGGTICMSLKRAGYEIYGFNRSPEPVRYALENKIIDGCAGSMQEYDVVFVALPPEATVKFINGTNFKDGAIVADICGVKQYIRDEVYKTPRNFLYVGCHPMAGKEVSGIQNACADLFDRASMVITSDKTTDINALEIVRTLTKDMGFKYIVECSAEIHDKKIAYTSQLAHIVSNAYVKDDQIDGCIGFTGGSFQDMTRIAGVDEEVWASLYLLNSQNLINNIDCLISSLTEIKERIERGDSDGLKNVLREGRQRFDSGKKTADRQDITVKKLK